MDHMTVTEADQPRHSLFAWKRLWDGQFTLNQLSNIWHVLYVPTMISGLILHLCDALMRAGLSKS